MGSKPSSGLAHRRSTTPQPTIIVSHFYQSWRALIFGPNQLECSTPRSFFVGSVSVLASSASPCSHIASAVRIFFFSFSYYFFFSLDGILGVFKCFFLGLICKIILQNSEVTRTKPKISNVKNWGPT